MESRFSLQQTGPAVSETIVREIREIADGSPGPDPLLQSPPAPAPAPATEGGTAPSKEGQSSSSLSPAPPSVDDPFAVRDDGTPWEDASPPPVSQSQADREADLRAKRDRASAKRKATIRKSADLESRTRDLLRSMGYLYARTEHYGWAGRKSDLFGFVDAVAIGEFDVLFVQTCRRADRAAHLKKMARGEYAMGGGSRFPCFDVARRLASLSAWSVRLVLVTWDQPGGPGTSWRHEVQDVAIADLFDARATKRGAA